MRDQVLRDVRSRMGPKVALFGAAFLVVSCAAGPGTNMPAGSHSMNLNPGARCGGELGGEYDRAVNPDRPDARLAAEAVRHFTNIERCRHGLRPLNMAPAAVTASEGHARAMAKHGFIGHTSPVRGSETFVRRLGKAGARFRIAGENVARTPFFAVGSQPYVVSDLATCRFADIRTGAPVPKNSYRSLGRQLVDIWMRSAAHRENLLRAEYRTMGAGIAVSRARSHCGHISAATTFLG